jgi:polar amino acid transport system ATP-binding protein
MLQLEKIKLFFFKDHLSVELDKGEVLGVLGPSGCGKTSLLKSLKGFFPKEGTIILNNEIINKNQDPRIAFVHQQPIFYDHWSIKQNLIFGNIYVKDQDEEKTLNKLYKLSEIFSMRKILNKKLKNLSIGEGQRLSIIRCLMMDPKIIIMDEPSSALDPENIKILINFINKLKKTEISLIIASHDINFIKKIADKIIFISNNGEVLFNNTLEKFFQTNNPIIKDFINSQE